jgi:hypothetical protein
VDKDRLSRALTERAPRFSRRQEALTIGWLRSLARSPSSTRTTAAEPAATTRRSPPRRADPDEPAG